MIYRINVLDHGFVALRNLSGPTRREWRSFDADDIDPANSARMSFDAMDSGRTRDMDLKLCRYLMEHRHTTPIEMIECWIEMKLPIFVARQFVRHRTATLNEMSGRYVQMPREWYIPKRVGGTAPNVKQGQVDTLDEATQAWFREELDAACRHAYQTYEEALAHGVAAEHARLLLHLNHYTHWLWKQDLHNLMHFLSLRAHSHAQVEAQRYAQAIDALIRQALPETMDLYDRYRRQPS